MSKEFQRPLLAVVDTKDGVMHLSRYLGRQRTDVVKYVPADDNTLETIMWDIEHFRINGLEEENGQDTTH